MKQSRVRKKTAELYVTKLAAAQRQLHAAIRMTFLAENELAIHTVVSASYRILRDLKRRRGRNEYVDWWRQSLYYIAYELASGKLTSASYRSTGRLTNVGAKSSECARPVSEPSAQT
jgi:hypothetical protein